MKVVIPMAGRGTRLRPHTLILPKPLMKLAGKTMIEWIVEEIKKSTSAAIDEIHFIIGDFGDAVEEQLKKTAEKIGSKGVIHYQLEALGTAHALYCAREALKDEVFVVFADTIFKGKIDIDASVDGIIWTMNVEDPEKYGVVKTDDAGIITDFIEKPKTFVSNNAIVGLYFFKEAEKLRSEIDTLIETNAKENNEFQLTNCLESLKQKGDKLKCSELDEWLDCGNKKELLATHKRLLEIETPETKYIHSTAQIIESKIEQGCSINKNSVIKNSTIINSIIYEGAVVQNSMIKDSIIGNYTNINGLNGTAYLGDFSEYENS